MISLSAASLCFCISDTVIAKAGSLDFNSLFLWTTREASSITCCDVASFSWLLSSSRSSFGITKKEALLDQNYVCFRKTTRKYLPQMNIQIGCICKAASALSNFSDDLTTIRVNKTKIVIVSTCMHPHILTQDIP